MAKVLKGTNKDGTDYYLIECPGCGHGHCYDKRWTFNGDYDKPTFNPSYLVRSGHYMPEHKSKDCWCNFNERFPNEPPVREMMKCMCCHSFVKYGKIQFLSDCSHKLAGQTVDLPDFD